MIEQTADQPVRDRAAYFRAYRASQRAEPPAAITATPPLRLPLRAIPKPEPEKRATQRPPWHFGDTGRVGGVRFGDDDWYIPADRDPAMAQPGGGSPRGRSHPAPIR